MAFANRLRSRRKPPRRVEALHITNDRENGRANWHALFYSYGKAKTGMGLYGKLISSSDGELVIVPLVETPVVLFPASNSSNVALPGGTSS